MDDNSESHQKSKSLDADTAKLAEKITNSGYFGYLVESEVDKQVNVLKDRYTKLFSFLATVAVVVLSIFGYQVYDVNKILKHQMAAAEALNEKYNKAETAERLLRERDSLLTLTTNLHTQLVMDAGSMKTSLIDAKEKIVAQQQEFLKDQQDILKYTFNDLKSLGIQEKLEEFRRTEASISEQRNQARDYLDSLRLYNENSIGPQVRALTAISGDIKKAASAKYFFVERGHKRTNHHDYRPATLQLPFSQDVITASFHTVTQDEKPKVVLVDFSRQGKMLAVDRVFTDVDEAPMEIVSTEGHKYEMKPVIIELPLNPPFYRIPDYIVFEVRLTSLANPPLTAK